VRATLAGSRGRYGSRLGDIHGLEAANLGGRSSFDTRRLTRLVGGLLAAYGLVRRGRTGSVIRTLGVGLAARGSRIGGARPPDGERRRTIDIQKTLYVDGPVEHVAALAGSCENFPLFISGIREVADLGGGRWRWSVDGPAGGTLSWVATITEHQPGRLLAWRSEPGAVLDSAGVIRFGAEGPGTRVDFRFCYSPPADPAGRGAEEFLGGDPRTKFNADLARLRTLLESTIKE
jgi:uncharacterized membrane protein